MNQLEVLARSRRPKKHEHNFQPTLMSDGQVVAFCMCGVTEAEFQSRQRRGRNNRKRGGGAELAVARHYGGEKVGPLGLPEDIRGQQWATQVKVSSREAPPMWRAEFGKLAGQRDRTPRLILRFARQGVKAEDYVVVRGEDWLAWFGRDE